MAQPKRTPEPGKWLQTDDLLREIRKQLRQANLSVRFTGMGYTIITGHVSGRTVPPANLAFELGHHLYGDTYDDRPRAYFEEHQIAILYAGTPGWPSPQKTHAIEFQRSPEGVERLVNCLEKWMPKTRIAKADQGRGRDRRSRATKSSTAAVDAAVD